LFAFSVWCAYVNIDRLLEKLAAEEKG
jgi:hypothetical protein